MNVLVAALAAIIITGCGGGGKKASIPVPEDAAFVMHINSASLGSKLNWSEIKSSEWFKIMLADAEDEEMTPLQKSILDNPENSGIDMKGDAYVSYHIRSGYGYIVMQGKLSDPKKFESVLGGMGDEVKIKKDGDINYSGKDEDNLVSWTADRFVLIQATPAPGGFEDDDEGGMRKLTTDSVLRYAKSIYNLKQGASMGGDSRFSSLMKEPGDMHVLYNASAFMGKGMEMLKILKGGSFLSDNAAGMVVNFENGKITVNSKSWYSKELGELMKKYQPGNFDVSMLKRIPSQNLAGLIAMNYPPEGIKEFVKMLGADGMLNGFMGRVGLSLDDFVKANKGDLLLAVSDFAVKEQTISIPMGDGEPYTYSDTRPDANILFATSVKDKAAFTKLVDAVKNEMGEDEDAVMGAGKVKYAFNDNWFVLGNNQSAVDGFAGGSNSSIAAFADRISGHPFGGFIDLQKILPNVKDNEMSGSDKEILAKAVETWDNIIFYGGEMKDGATVGHFEINMKDKSANSLKQFFGFINNIAMSKMRGERGFDEDMKVEVPDSTILFTPPVIIEEKPKQQ